MCYQYAYMIEHRGFHCKKKTAATSQNHTGNGKKYIDNYQLVSYDKHNGNTCL